MGIKLHKLIKPELEFLKDNCNFTYAEMEVFDLLAKGHSIKQISIELSMSEPSVNRRIKGIKNKIERNDNYGRSNKGTDLGEDNIDN